MELDKEGSLASLYVWFYGGKLPETICSYAPKLLLMLILIIPYMIFCIPAIVALIDKDFDNDNDKYTHINRPLISLVIYVALFILLLLSAFFWTSDEKLFGSSIIVWVVIILISSVGLISYLFKKGQRSNVMYITKEYIKAKKGKYCTKINWK